MLHFAPLPDSSVDSPSIRDGPRTSPLVPDLDEPSFGALRDHPQEAHFYTCD